MISQKELNELQHEKTSKAYSLGYDCEKNGANDENCHFAIFATHQSMKEWERGKYDARKSKRAGPTERKNE